MFYFFDTAKSFGGIGGVGVLIYGLACNRFGRKRLLAIAAATNVAGWCIISLFNRKDSSFLPTLGRILEGFGAGMISNLVPVYIAEITPNNMRGIFGAVHQFAKTIGIMLGYSLVILVTWKEVALYGIIPCGILFVGSFCIPESPMWLARQGRVQEGNSILQELRGSGEDITHEWGEIMINAQANPQNTCSEYLNNIKQHWNPLIKATAVLALQQLSGTNGMILYARSIFGINDPEKSLKSIQTGVWFIQVLGTGLSIVILVKYSQKFVLGISALATTLSLIIIGLHVMLNLKFTGGMAEAGIFVGLFCFSLGMGPIPWIIMSEIIPEALKSNIAGCVPTFANWILLIGTNTDYYKQSSQWRFAFYAIAAAFTGGFTLIFMNE